MSEQRKSRSVDEPTFVLGDWWSEKSFRTVKQMLARIAALEERVAKLEEAGRNKNGAENTG